MMGGMGPFGGMGGMGGMGGFDQGDVMPQVPSWVSQFDETCERIAMGLVSARVRTRALLELLEEKGILAEGQFEQRAAQVWERDYDELSNELTEPLREPPAAPGEPAAEEQGEAEQRSGGSSLQDYYAGVLFGFVDDSVGARVRLRSVVELLEAKGVFAPGEYDQKAESIWDRDYEELVLEFHKGSF